MRTRARFLSLALIFALVSTLPAAEAPNAVTPNAALALLKAGHQRFVSGALTHPNQDAARRLETSKGQHPYAAILGCADSRGSLDVIFDAGLGDLFTIRVAGNVADVDEIASLEYGAEHLGVPLIVVLGHTSCGACTAVVKKSELTGQLPGLLDNILAPAARAAAQFGASAPDLVDQTARENVLQSIQDMLERSKALSELVESGKLKVVGGLYHLDTGDVEWSESLPNLEKWVAKGLTAPTVTPVSYDTQPAPVAPVVAAPEVTAVAAEQPNELLWALGLAVLSVVFLALIQKMFVSERRLARGLKLRGRLIASSLALVAVLSAGTILAVSRADLSFFAAALVPVLLFSGLYARAHYRGFESFFNGLKAKWAAEARSE